MNKQERLAYRMKRLRAILDNPDEDAERREFSQGVYDDIVGQAMGDLQLTPQQCETISLMLDVLRIEQASPLSSTEEKRSYASMKYTLLSLLLHDTLTPAERVRRLRKPL